MTRLPAWLQRHLETIGAANTDGVARKARATRCRRCGAPILAGLDADICGWPARVDPAPLTAQGEAAAILTGRTTYRLNGTHSHIEIDRREDFNIRGTPPSDECIVVAEHACGKQLAGIQAITATPANEPKEETCPF